MRAGPLALAALLALPGVAAAQKGGPPVVAAPPPSSAPPSTSPPTARGRSSDAAAVAALPGQIGAFARQEGVTDYESRPNGRGLGASINYEIGTGSPYATVYLYDRDRTDLGSNPVGPGADAELAVTRREIEAASERRGYRIGSATRMPDVPGPSGAAFRCDAYTFEWAEDGTVADSYACVGIARGRFVKVRVSFRPRAATVAQRTLPLDFLRGVAEATGFGEGGRPAAGGKG